METPDLQSQLITVKAKAEAVKYKNYGNGNTPEFWGLVAEKVRLQIELRRRREK